MTTKESKLLIKPNYSKTEFITVSPEIARWQHLSFLAVSLQKGKEWTFDTNENELALVILGGTCDVKSDYGNFDQIGSRSDVFHGLPTTLFFSRHTHLTINVVTDTLEFACGSAIAKNDFPARLILPEEVSIELRGGENASRQINKMIPPGFPCDRLVVVEVYTPSGNWSSYPPHKHDTRTLDEKGNLLEADLEEIYFYKMNRPEGFAYQRIYNDNRSIDELIMVSNNQLVLSPEGYHPVVSAFGYDTYYLNMLAGTDQSLASSDDPAYSWVKETWNSIDPRLPLVSLDMNRKGK